MGKRSSREREMEFFFWVGGGGGWGGVRKCGSVMLLISYNWLSPPWQLYVFRCITWTFARSTTDHVLALSINLVGTPII